MSSSGSFLVQVAFVRADSTRGVHSIICMFFKFEVSVPVHVTRRLKVRHSGISTINSFGDGWSISWWPGLWLNSVSERADLSVDVRFRADFFQLESLLES